MQINLEDERQDVHKVRKHNPGLFRYSVAEKLLPENCSGLNLLEIGGGTGELSMRLKDKGAKVTFVDLSESNLLRAKDLGLRAIKIDLNEYGHEQNIHHD